MPNKTPRFRKNEVSHSVVQNPGMSEEDKQIIGEPQTEFPWDAVPVEIKEYCLVKADFNCNDPVAVFTHLLPALGALIGPDTWTHSGDGDWYNPPILQTMNVGDPSRGKSTAIEIGIEPIKILDQKLSEVSRKELKTWQDEYEKAPVKEKERIKEKKPIEKECYCQDINYETIVSELSQFPSQLYYIDEGRFYFQNLKTGQKDNLGAFNSLWNGRCGSSKRKSGKIKVNGFVCFNVTMGIQPEILKKYLCMDEFKESGFNDRFLFYYSEAEMPRLMDEHRYSNQEKLRVEVSMNEKARLLVEKQFELRAKYNEKLSKGENPWQRIRVLEIQGQARERLYKFTDAIMHSKAYKEYGSKAGNFISRIALILTIFKNPKIENEGLIELAEIESAIEIWKFYYYKYTQLFSTSDEIEVLKGAIISFIENHPDFKATGKIRHNRIWQNFSKIRSRKPLFERAIAELLEEEELIQLESSNPRSKIYTIPPPE